MKRGWRTWYRRALPAYWIFLFLATHFPRLDLRGTPVPSDKFMHFMAFALLAFLYWRFRESFGRPIGSRFVWSALAVLGGYSAVDEYLQGFVGRSPDIRDWAANMSGVTTTLALLELVRRYRAGRNKRAELGI